MYGFAITVSLVIMIFEIVLIARAIHAHQSVAPYILMTFAFAAISLALWRLHPIIQFMQAGLPAHFGTRIGQAAFLVLIVAPIFFIRALQIGFPLP